MDDDFVFRIGMFFYVIGGGSFVLFVTSDIADKVDFDFLFVALLMFGIGAYLRRGMAPPPSAGRFASFKKWRENAKNKKQQKQEAKKK
ncbi:MAG TPA: hypothetical protein PKE35_09580 [Anaerolineales bacterium]|nr:hypothetical protein [Anaerolineales bacterium]HMV97201.1 hypothetical protein [Anaerolineales bacterium]HMX18289.1 hypothetical protein [Anaerolineales bacterium]HMX74494.1 hypothetical protein [Anaerolineales bacterium]HMZ41753.1 hypothetical protein [Anaerolineales bacterium]